MKGIIRRKFGKVVSMHKTFDFSHGYGYHVQIIEKGIVGYGFSRNKFTAYKKTTDNWISHALKMMVYLKNQ